MLNRLDIRIGTKKYSAFLQDGFYSSATQKTPFHKHSYAEIHLVANGEIDFKIGDDLHSFGGGNIFLIPSNTFHSVITENSSARHVAFQIDCEEQSLLKKQISDQTISDFLKEIEKSLETKDYTVVSAYISLFFSQLCSEGLQAHPIDDYPFLFREFFSRHYNEDLRLSDLARELHLSERQTERLLIKYTGNTFKQELSAIRVDMARHLSAVSDLPLEEIALSVGYHSYSGLWKAIKKHKKEQI